MRITYDEIKKLAGNNAMYPVQAACKKLVEQGIRGKLEIYPNNQTSYVVCDSLTTVPRRILDGDGLPDVIYPSIVTAAKDGNAKYRQKGKDYAAWYPIAKKKTKQQKTGSDDYVVFLSEEAYKNKKLEIEQQLAIMKKCEYIKEMYESVVNKQVA